MIFFYLALFGLIGTSILAFFSNIAGWLTKSGALTMVVLGTAIFTLSPEMTFYLALFFASSYGIQALKKQLHTELASDKNGPRDAWQVLANCGPLLLFLLIELWTKDPRFALCQITAIAAATADTWSSEIGVLSKHPPRLLFSLNPATAGLSGAVSLLGTLAGVAGSGLIALFLGLSHWLFASETPFSYGLVLLLGFAGTLIDSLLGAFLQVKYRTATGELTDKAHTGQQPNAYAKGLPHFTNDGVNFVTGILAGVFAFLIQ